MKLIELGPLKARITGGSDREGGGDGPVVVLMHGFGAPGDDLVGLWRVLDVPHALRFVFPEAPVSLPEFGPYGARAWWRLDLSELEAAQRGERRDRSHEDPEGLAPAREAASAMLDAVQTRLNVDGSRIVLGGFSQGAMVACDVTLRSERPLAGLVLLSGTLLARQIWEPAMPARSALPIFQSHGRTDALLPFDRAVELRDMWRAAGAQVRFEEFGGGHEIPQSVLTALGEFLRRCLPTP
jgi:phospholipase/carboxylesterase